MELFFMPRGASRTQFRAVAPRAGRSPKEKIRAKKILDIPGNILKSSCLKREKREDSWGIDQGQAQ